MTDDPSRNDSPLDGPPLDDPMPEDAPRRELVDQQPDASRRSFARYRDAMEAEGFHPSKKLGQNFLLDPSLHRAIADAASLTKADLVLEVGPGLGFLTRELARQAWRVVSVEIDDRLASIVEADVASDPAYSVEHGAAPVRIVRSDALAGSALSRPLVAAVAEALEELPAGGRLAVVANLPYASSGRFLAALLEGSSPAVTTALRCVVVVIQAELGERLAAPSGSRTFGGLSALAQATGRVELVRRIGREVFRPRPKVDSAVVRIEVDRPAPAGFSGWLRVLFQFRRKTMRHALKRLADLEGDGEIVLAALVERFGARRAESCSVSELLEVFAAGRWRGDALSDDKDDFGQLK